MVVKGNRRTCEGNLMVFLFFPNRLNDFKDTPTSSLTINQFLEIDLEHEHDPPSFIVSKKRVKKKSVKVIR